MFQHVVDKLLSSICRQFQLILDICHVSLFFFGAFEAGPKGRHVACLSLNSHGVRLAYVRVLAYMYAIYVKPLRSW